VTSLFLELLYIIKKEMKPSLSWFWFSLSSLILSVACSYKLKIYHKIRHQVEQEWVGRDGHGKQLSVLFLGV
jgi:hypothetical protein